MRANKGCWVCALREILSYIKDVKAHKTLKPFGERNYGIEMIYHLEIAKSSGIEVSITDLHKMISEPKPTQIALRDFLGYLEGKKALRIENSSSKKNRKSVRLDDEVSIVFQRLVNKLYDDIRSSAP